MEYIENLLARGGGATECRKSRTIGQKYIDLLWEHWSLDITRDLSCNAITKCDEINTIYIQIYCYQLKT